MKIIVTVGWNDAPCEFGMDEGIAFARHIETLLKHSTDKDLEIRIKRVEDKPVEEEGAEISE